MSRVATQLLSLGPRQACAPDPGFTPPSLTPTGSGNCGGRSWLELLRLLMMKIIEVTALGNYTMVEMTLNAFGIGTQADD
jgi:hypothetical protein